MVVNKNVGRFYVNGSQSNQWTIIYKGEVPHTYRITGLEANKGITIKVDGINTGGVNSSLSRDVNGKKIECRGGLTDTHGKYWKLD